MKKTLLVMLALIMTFATVISTVSLVSANTDASADVKYMDASLNEVEVDGEITLTNGKGLGYGTDGITITSPCEAPTAEFALETFVENAYVGAAWSQTEGNVYFGINALASVELVNIKIGGMEAELDPTMSSSVTGIAGAFATKNADDTIIEIALPLEGLELKSNGRYLYTDIDLTISAGGIDGKFVGRLQFTDYSANYVFNAIQAQRAPDVANTSSIDGENVISIVDDRPANQRSYAIVWTNGALETTKNVAIEFDMKVNEMPCANVFGGGPGMWQSESDGQARMWFCIRYRYNDQFYFNIINHVDKGLVLIIQEQTGAPQGSDPGKGDGHTIPADPQEVVLNKDPGDLFRLKIEWSEANHGIISVDGKVVYETDRTKSDSTHVGKATGMLSINTMTPSEFEPDAKKIDVEMSNFAISNLNESYNINTLAALAGTTLDEINGGSSEGDTPSGDTPSGDTPSGDTPAGDTPSGDQPSGDASTNDSTDSADADTSDDASDDASEEEEKGCGSSIAGMGAVMIAGTALVTAIGSSKKRRK
ncbi:MAG: hypothetical protein J6Q78_05660 [Clostridia bacterium]|nr:hypothetical protein [Clostridia bacterium]